MLDKLPIKFKFCEIKGHQDDHMDYNLLDRLLQMNIEVDQERGKSILTQAHRTPNITRQWQRFTRKDGAVGSTVKKSHWTTQTKVQWKVMVVGKLRKFLMGKG